MSFLYYHCYCIYLVCDCDCGNILIVILTIIMTIVIIIIIANMIEYCVYDNYFGILGGGFGLEVGMLCTWLAR